MSFGKKSRRDIQTEAADPAGNTVPPWLLDLRRTTNLASFHFALVSQKSTPRRRVSTSSISFVDSCEYCNRFINHSHEDESSQKWQERASWALSRRLCADAARHDLVNRSTPVLIYTPSAMTEHSQREWGSRHPRSHSTTSRALSSTVDGNRFEYQIS